MGALGHWRATYAPGDWLVLCGPTSLVVTEPPGAGWTALAEELWQEVVGAASMVDLAARLAGYGLDTMPSFGALFWTGNGMRSLVRGGVRLIDPETGTVVASGHGVQTWSEVGLGELTTVRLVTGEVDTDESPDEDDVLLLPLVVGAVRASAVLLDSRAEARLTSPQLDEDEDEAEVDAADQRDAEDDRDALTSRTDPEPDLPETQPEAPPLPRGVPEPTVSLGHVEDADTQLVPAALLLGDGAPGSAAGSGPTVLAVLCPSQHPNPPGSSRCRECGARVTDARPRPIGQPALATLRVTDGTEAVLDQVVLVGRAPSARGNGPSRLLTVPSPAHDISRTHLEIVPDGWRVLVRDLNSTNGTVLVAPDGSSRRPLPPGQAVPVPLGSSLELAEGVAVLLDLPQ